LDRADEERISLEGGTGDGEEAEPGKAWRNADDPRRVVGEVVFDRLVAPELRKALLL
jgi:hypothetical protein